MNYKKMKALYPTASLQSTNDFNMDYLFIPVENGYIKIPRKDLTKREEELLSLIIGEKQVDVAKHPFVIFEMTNFYYFCWGDVKKRSWSL